MIVPTEALMAIDASDVFLRMDGAIEECRDVRTSTSKDSPQQGVTVEAEPGRVFTLSDIALNVPTNTTVDLRWAVANTLHFFADTGRAEPLTKYNRHAERFVKDGRWLGAYGLIAGCQLRNCAEELRTAPESRRAIVSMGEMLPADINRPACWNHLHFLKWRGKLDMLVEQRSLMLHGVMAYDCVVLTNVLFYMACTTSIPAGSLRWRVGSLHKLGSDPRVICWNKSTSLILPYAVLSDSALCWQWLCEPAQAYEPWRSILEGKE